MQAMYRSWLPATREGWVVCAYVAVALVFGGGGSPSALAEILVQLAFAAALFAWIVWARVPVSPVPAGHGLLAWIAAVPLVLVALQLVPLPPVLWQALPGRALEARMLGLIDAEDSWRPLSIAPYQTLASLLAMIPPLLLVVAVARIGRHDRRVLLRLVAAVGIAGALLGVMQMAGSETGFRLYEQANRGWVTGFFANRNAAADGFLVASMALAAVFAASADGQSRRPREFGIVVAALQFLLLAALVLTGSRAGIALSLVALVVQASFLRGTLERRGRLAMIVVAALAAAAVVASFAISALPRLAGVASRFAASGDVRTKLWEDAWYAAWQYFPFGSGMGTFVEAFLPFEQLENIDASYPNRAHMDYLELLIEGGLPAIVALLVCIGLVLVLVRRAFTDRTVPRAHRVFAAGTLAVVALHSIVDYPLRTMALASLAAIAVGLLVPRVAGGSTDRDLDGSND